MKSRAVLDLESQTDYQIMAAQTMKSRKTSGKHKKFMEMRGVIRNAAAAARAAYVDAAKAQPDTPNVNTYLQVLASGICTRYLHQVFAPGICTRYLHQVLLSGICTRYCYQVLTVIRYFCLNVTHRTNPTNRTIPGRGSSN